MNIDLGKVEENVNISDLICPSRSMQESWAYDRARTVEGEGTLISSALLGSAPCSVGAADNLSGLHPSAAL